MLTLYQMPLSHYCEKARWALARKRLPVKCKNWLPGLHIKPAKRLSGQTALPILKDGPQVIAGSAAILDHLDARYPRFPLSAATADEDRTRERALEAYADEHLGPAVRLLAYSALLDRPDLLIPMMNYEGPWYGQWLMKRAFPRVREALVNRYHVNEQGVAEAKIAVHKALDYFAGQRQENAFFIGGQFGRADLSIASLLAPLYMPSAYGAPWPASPPLACHQLAEEFADWRPWVEGMYQRYRK